MNAIRLVRSTVPSSAIVPVDRAVPDRSMSTTSRVHLACRWQRTADGRLACVWARIPEPPRRRPALTLVTEEFRSC